MDFKNVYEDERRADAYDKLEFPGTYYLAYRDLPAIIDAYAKGPRALDFGCGTGRSTRFLRRLGFDPVGVDISEEMLTRARQREPEGDYRLVSGGNLGILGDASFDLVLSAFTFDNIPGGAKVPLFRELRRVVHDDGVVVVLVSSPDIYTHEWSSFTTRDFPENRLAKSGEKVRIVMTDVPDSRPVEDIVWSDESYRDVFRQAGLKVIDVHKPLGKPDEGYAWVNETTLSPWVIYTMKTA